MFGILFYIFLFFMGFCRAKEQGMIESYYTINSCSDTSVTSILQDEVLETFSPTSFLSCAASCNVREDCHHAIFNASELAYSCKQIATVHPSIEDTKKDLTHETCRVLTKILGERTINSDSEGNLISLPQCPAERWTAVVTSEDYQTLVKQPTQLVTPGPQVYPWLSVTDGIEGVIVATQGFVAVKWTNTELELPIKFEFEAYFQKNGVEMKASISSSGLVNTRSSRIVPSGPDLIQRETSAPEGNLIYDTRYDSVGDIMDAVLKGYRRFERHPTRIVIDRDEDDIRFEKTKAFIVNTVNDFQEPFYYSSIKESVKNGVRHTLRHEINKNNVLPYAETEADKTWVMDTCWTKISPVGNQADFLKAVREKVVEGNDIRVVINGNISSDTLIINAKDTEVIAYLPSYLTPSKGDASMDLGKIRVHVPAVSFFNRIVECETDLQESYVFGNGMHHVDTVDWYVSTRKWQAVYAVKDTNTVTVGNTSILYDVIKSGQRIRVCYGSSYNFCFGPTKIIADSKNSITALTPVSFSVHYGSDSKLKGATPGCDRTVSALTISGSLHMVKFKFGGGSESSFNFPIRKQTWFVEQVP